MNGLGHNRLLFFSRDPCQVAPELLGWHLRHSGVCLEIVETEAYGGSLDLASHARSGPTERCRAMFGPVDRAYLYLSYGVHLCLNVVCHRPETGGAVLIRAGRIVDGLRLAQSRRGEAKGLADGPGKLAQTLALDMRHNGCDLLEGELQLYPGRPIASSQIQSGPRIGITRSVELPHRYWLRDCPEVSR